MFIEKFSYNLMVRPVFDMKLILGHLHGYNIKWKLTNTKINENDQVILSKPYLKGEWFQFAIFLIWGGQTMRLWWFLELFSISWLLLWRKGTNNTHMEVEMTLGFEHVLHLNKEPTNLCPFVHALTFILLMMMIF